MSTFKYMSENYLATVFTEGLFTCDCCRQVKELKYIGPQYSSGTNDAILCAQCIQNGEAVESGLVGFLMKSILNVLMIMYQMRFVAAHQVSLLGKTRSGQRIVKMHVNFMEMLLLKILLMQMRVQSASGWRDMTRAGKTGTAL